MATPALSKAEFAGLGAIAKARQDNMATMFAGTKLQFTKEFKQNVVQDAISNANDVYGGVTGLLSAIKTGGKTASAISGLGDVHTNSIEFIKIAMNVHDLSDVIAALGSDTLQSLIDGISPFWGVVTASKEAAMSWRAVVGNVRDLYKKDYYLQGVLPGDPTAAAEAVIVVIKRFLAANSADAVRNTTGAAFKIAGLFADLGTVTTAAVGLATTLAKLIQDLAIIGRDYVEMKNANALLMAPGKLDLNVFKVCPTLGCYLISCSDTSMVLNFFVADIGLPGWQDKVEAMKKNQLDPLIRNANKAIVSSHLTLAGLQANKGTVASKGTLDRIKENVKHHFNQLVKSGASRSLKA